MDGSGNAAPEAWDDTDEIVDAELDTRLWSRGVLVDALSGGADVRRRCEVNCPRRIRAIWKVSGHFNPRPAVRKCSTIAVSDGNRASRTDSTEYLPKVVVRQMRATVGESD